MALDTGASGDGFEPIAFTARDGLRLYARHYPSPGSTLRPAVCLAGLTRNSRDFHALALSLSQVPHTGRPVYTLDARGRGLSEHDPDWRNYAVPIEMLDVLDFMTAHGLHDAAIIGTSRGGLIAMLMAAAQPGTLGAVVLNDIGPVIEADGLARIAGYVGRVPTPTSWDDAARIIANMARKQFPAIPDSEWAEVARAWFNDKNGRPALAYDPKLAKALSVTDGPPPALWPQFAGLNGVPVLAIRGESSDILSAATLAEMVRRHPNCATLTVPGQGHAPLLRDRLSHGAIHRFLTAADAGRSVAGVDLGRS